MHVLLYINTNLQKHKKHLLYFVTIFLMLFLGGCQAEELATDKPIAEVADISPSNINTSDYYWYGDQQVGLDRVYTRRFVIFRESEYNNMVHSFNMRFEPKEFNLPNHIIPVDAEVYTSSSFSSSEKLLWSIVDSSVPIPDAIYDLPLFVSEHGEEIGISNIFYVKLFSEQHENLLIECCASPNSITIVGKSEFDPLWYTLACTNESAGDALEMANAFHESGFFEAAEPDRIFNIQMSDYSSDPITPYATTSDINDEWFDYQWGLYNSGNSEVDINFLKSFDITRGNENIIVAIMDDGIWKDHPDINNLHTKSYNTVTGKSPSDFKTGWHGTACAGIIGATTNNRIGIAGIADKVQLMDISINIDQYASQVIPQIANGIDFAIRNDVSVINFSNGFEESNNLDSKLLDDAISRALKNGRNGKGIVFVCSAGNQYTDKVAYPARSFPDVLAVGATNLRGEKSDFSQYGPELDIVAPGQSIWTTITPNRNSPIDNYNSESGTSFAAPHASAVAALILSVNPDLTQKEVVDIIEKTAIKLPLYASEYANTPGRPNGTWHNKTGYGLLDAYAAVKMADPTPPIETKIIPEVPVSEMVLNTEYGFKIQTGEQFKSIKWSAQGLYVGDIYVRYPQGTEPKIRFERPDKYTITANIKYLDGSSESTELIVDLSRFGHQQVQIIVDDIGDVTGSDELYAFIKGSTISGTLIFDNPRLALHPEFKLTPVNIGSPNSHSWNHTIVMNPDKISARFTITCQAEYDGVYYLHASLSNGAGKTTKVALIISANHSEHAPIPYLSFTDETTPEGGFFIPPLPTEEIQRIAGKKVFLLSKIVSTNTAHDSIQDYIMNSCRFKVTYLNDGSNIDVITTEQMYPEYIVGMMEYPGFRNVVTFPYRGKYLIEAIVKSPFAAYGAKGYTIIEVLNGNPPMPDFNIILNKIDERTVEASITPNDYTYIWNCEDPNVHIETKMTGSPIRGDYEPVTIISFNSPGVYDIEITIPQFNYAKITKRITLGTIY